MPLFYATRRVYESNFFAIPVGHRHMFSIKSKPIELMHHYAVLQSVYDCHPIGKNSHCVAATSLAISVDVTCSTFSLFAESCLPPMTIISMSRIISCTLWSRNF